MRPIPHGLTISWHLAKWLDRVHLDSHKQDYIERVSYYLTLLHSFLLGNPRKNSGRMAIFFRLFVLIRYFLLNNNQIKHNEKRERWLKKIGARCVDDDKGNNIKGTGRHVPWANMSSCRSKPIELNGPQAKSISPLLQLLLQLLFASSTSNTASIDFSLTE